MGSVYSFVSRDLVTGARCFDSSASELVSNAVLVSGTDIFFRYSNISSFRTLPPFPDPPMQLSLIYCNKFQNKLTEYSKVKKQK
jgi:hypothetical protein